MDHPSFSTCPSDVLFLSPPPPSPFKSHYRPVSTLLNPSQPQPSPAPQSKLKRPSHRPPSSSGGSAGSLSRMKFIPGRQRTTSDTILKAPLDPPVTPARGFASITKKLSFANLLGASSSPPNHVRTSTPTIIPANYRVHHPQHVEAHDRSYAEIMQEREDMELNSASEDDSDDDIDLGPRRHNFVGKACVNVRGMPVHPYSPESVVYMQAYDKVSLERQVLFPPTLKMDANACHLQRRLHRQPPSTAQS
jgi:hypothetical protein